MRGPATSRAPPLLSDFLQHMTGGTPNQYDKRCIQHALGLVHNRLRLYSPLPHSCQAHASFLLMSEPDAPNCIPLEAVHKGEPTVSEARGCHNLARLLFRVLVTLRDGSEALQCAVHTWVLLDGCASAVSS